MNIPCYLLKISMMGISPEIWRRFVVPANIALDRLHDVIQIVMGWTDTHLYVFMHGDEKYTEDPEDPMDDNDAAEYSLKEVLKKKGDSFVYMYDFGDGWEHLITVESSDYEPEKFIRPFVCLDGARSCPPEDVGGPYRYDEFLSAYRDPSHPDHAWYREYLGDDFDSELFNVDEVNRELAKYLRWLRSSV
ncbi:MAG TPA: plasmid pRiA4b ORF-3 family protein [Thermoanaerobaculia bacterium]|nr:plasmid pRiA4b ORF-3 family protein [Thermoanaerobaculia bacterium]HUM31272.1 plasmid pRiA4b ORF-3 family protein [Thermoanaerobaculia bacterium]HXK69626.1 plasmid pRiA4b ORF-3 family protein [Thermoanaerobaculia bacterium]